MCGAAMLKLLTAGVSSVSEEAIGSGVARARAALSQGRIFCARQGVHEIGDAGRLLYSECLARLVDGRGEVHAASGFVPFLEVSGDVPLLDRHMLELVFAALEEEPDVVLGCNLSACTLSNRDHCSALLKTIEVHGAAAKRLVLEVTETSPLQGIGAVSAFLSEVQALGCRIAIDDFGVGYATPARLFDVNVDIVKIDASFMRRVVGGWSDRDSLYHMVGLAACAAPVVVVEGVETDEHLCMARGAGATHVQGYLLSHPTLPQSLSCQMLASDGVWRRH